MVNGDQVHLMQIFQQPAFQCSEITQEGGEIQFLVEEYETNPGQYAKYAF